MTTRRQFLKGALAATGLTLFASGRHERDTLAQARPNILLIMVDDLPLPAVRHLEKTGKRVRDEGIDFANTFAVSPMCGPDRASLLTGLYVHNHEIFVNDGAGAKMIETGLHGDSMATRVRAQGYTTGMFGKFQNEHPPSSIPAGWDRFVSMHEPYNKDDYFYATLDGERRRISRRGSSETGWLADQAGAFVRARREAPWFCYVAPHSPHLPSHASARSEERAEGIPLYPSPARSERGLSDKAEWVRNQSEPSDRYLRQRYEGAVAETYDLDQLVDRLVEVLSDTGQLRNTYVIFTNDNGYAFGEHDLEGKAIPYDDDTRLPLFVRGPGIQAGRSSRRLVSLVDVTATVVDLAGGAWQDLDGRSLVPLLTGGGGPWRSRLLVESFMKHEWRLVRDERYAYIRGRDGFEELYDVVEDPHQMASISSDPRARAIVERKRSELAALRDARGPGLRAAEE